MRNAFKMKSLPVILGLVLLASPLRAEELSVLKTRKDMANYGIGVDVVRNLQQLGAEIDLDLVMKGMRDAVSGDKLLLSEKDLKKVLIEYQTEMRRRQKLSARIASEDNGKKGEAFWSENKNKEGVVALPSGLQYKIIKTGEGKKPTDTDLVECNFRAAHLDGTEFDSTYASGKPRTYQVTGGVIAGWKEALKLMTVGSRWQLFVPPRLAYGEKGAGRIIGPNETLIYEVELVAIK